MGRDRYQIIERLTGRHSPVLRRLALHKARHKTDRRHQIWQAALARGAHPEIIEGEQMARQKLDHIHLNPVKRGYVDDPLHWRYPSARNYAGEPGLIEAIRDW